MVARRNNREDDCAKNALEAFVERTIDEDGR